MLVVAKKVALNLVAAGILAAIFSSYDLAYAQGEHSRRAGAELVVMLGDAHLLNSTSGTAVSEKHRIGLLDRIRGSVVTLDVLLRLAEQERGTIPESRLDVVRQLEMALEAGNFDSVVSSLENLASLFVLDLPDLIPSPDSGEAVELHQTMCAACHDLPNLDVERPAYNLFEQANTVSEIEMFARMLVGVRGDRVTGLDNPLSDRQIVDLLYYYSGGQFTR